eukprot:GILK01001190.1.p1 GENE.GILK01001190.1~~GILK01001190.1.p1  ORF type:complete len:511 (-),score=73.14 GILK01001190.1:128-1507(-)
MAENYGFDDQLKYRLGLVAAVDRNQVYSLFEQLPAAVYLRDPSYDPTSDAPAQFYMFAHGGIQLSFDPNQFLAHAPDARIVRLTFTNWSPWEQLAINVVRWSDVGEKPLMAHASSSSQTVTFFVEDSTADRKTVDRNARVITSVIRSSQFKFGEFETVAQPGFMWNDMTTDEEFKDGERLIRAALVAVPHRGYMLPKTLVENYMRLNSIKTIFRAHQHNGDFLAKLQQDNGLYAVFPKKEYPATRHAITLSRAWYTRIVPLGLSSAYTLNSSPNSGLGNNFDSFVILDFGGSHPAPLLSHHFCQLPVADRDGIRRGVRCWHVPQPNTINAGDTLYGVEHDAKSVTLFASREECKSAAQQRHHCVSFVVLGDLNTDAVTDPDTSVVKGIKFADLIYPMLDSKPDIVADACHASMAKRHAVSQHGWFFDRFTSQTTPQWLICDRSLLQMQVLGKRKVHPTP